MLLPVYYLWEDARVGAKYGEHSHINHNLQEDMKAHQNIFVLHGEINRNGDGWYLGKEEGADGWIQ